MVKVQVEQGLLEGEQLDLVTGDGQYYSFKGVPYAEPPIGQLRFKVSDQYQLKTDSLMLITLTYFNIKQVHGINQFLNELFKEVNNDLYRVSIYIQFPNMLDLTSLCLKLAT